MIVLVGATDRSDQYGYLRQVWQQRYQERAREAGWSLDGASGIGRDRFDGADTVYLLSIDTHGNVLGGLRLMPSVGPHPLEAMSAALFADGMPNAENVWIISRFCCLEPSASAHCRDLVARELVCGLYEYALQSDIGRVVCVTQLSRLPVILKAGWHVRPLGLPVPIKGSLAVALGIDLDPSHFEIVRAACGSARNVLHVAAAPEPTLEMAI